MRGPFLAFLMLLGLSTPAAADMVTFRDAERSIAFSYDDKLWQPSDLPIPRMIFRIERRLLDGKPTAACQLRALRTAFAAVTAGRVHEEREEIVSRILNSIDRSEFEVISSTSSAITLGSQPMIELRNLGSRLIKSTRR